ncbi:MAG: hypothetical protein DMD67_01830 [Gemmatimonadetes bacterium]|nr:MAG: hypothetical protein DMD67_01830 [Gemmatimonadota bacterium]
MRDEDPEVTLLCGPRAGRARQTLPGAVGPPGGEVGGHSHAEREAAFRVGRPVTLEAAQHDAGRAFTLRGSAEERRLKAEDLQCQEAVAAHGAEQSELSGRGAEQECVRDSDFLRHH